MLKRGCLSDSGLTESFFGNPEYVCKCQSAQGVLSIEDERRAIGRGCGDGRNDVYILLGAAKPDAITKCQI